jgi:predicted hydrocarbon binding protein
MQGIVFIELAQFLDELLGPGAWQRTLEHAGLADRVYTPHDPGPDPEFVAIVTSAAQEAGQPYQSLLEGFGEYLAPDLLGGLYGLLLDPSWDLLDFLENTEGALHTVVRARDPAATPPRLRVVRPHPDEVVILYSSSRRLCSLAKGIVRAAARRYGEAIEVSEPRCMLVGDSRCEIIVRRKAGSGAAGG